MHTQGEVPLDPEIKVINQQELYSKTAEAIGRSDMRRIIYKRINSGRRDQLRSGSTS